MSDAPQRTVALTHKIGEWLRRAHLQDEGAVSDIAVDLADLLAGAEQVSERLNTLLKLDPSVPGDADRALTLTGEMEAYLFTEMKHHLGTLERAWPGLLQRLGELSPAEGSP